MVSSAPPSAARAAGRCCARSRSDDIPPAATTAIAISHGSVDLTRNLGAFMVGEAYTILFSTGQNRACPSSRASEASRGAVVYSPRFFHSFAQEELGHMGHWLVVISARGLLIVLLFFSTSSAQSVSTAQINGAIKDQSGAGLPGVTIPVAHTDTGLTRNGRQLTELVFQAGLATGGKATGDAPGANALNTGVRSYPNTTIVVAGGLSNGMTYLLDGGTHNDPFNNLNLPLPFPDAMQEFKVETSALPAQYGHHSAAAVNAVTKSGTNAFHGDAFEFRRDHRLNATNAFAAIGPNGKRRGDGLHRDQFGGTLGGPIVQGKLFFFGGYQGTRINQTPTSFFQFVPTAAMLAGDFSTIASPACNTGRTIALRAPFAGTTVSPTQFSPAALALAAKLPKPINDCGQSFFDRRTENSEHMALGRVDYQWSNNHSLFGRYQLARLTSKPDNDPNNVLAYANGPIDDMVHSFVFGDTYLLGPNTVNSLRVTYNSSQIDKGYVPFFDAKSLGVRNIATPLPGFTAFTVSGGFTLGPTGAKPSAIHTTSFQIVDDVSLVRGAHQIGLGANYIHSGLSSTSYRSAAGNYAFTGVNTGLGLADFLLGRPATFTQGQVYGPGGTMPYIGIYAQDAWKVSSRLTLNLGLRWDPYLPYVNNQQHANHFSIEQFNAGARSTVYKNAPVGVIFEGDPQ